jgi:hypothetical protein
MLFELTKLRNEKILKTVKEIDLQEAGWKEKDLEDLLAKNITSLIREEYLMPISQESPMKEEPDILALDKEGTLYIFELKRTQSEPEHLLQVLRYGQRFGVYNYNQLNKKYKKFEKGSRSDLKEAHEKYFNLEEKLNELKFNNKQKFIVVTNGIDVKTLRSIKYWQDQNLPLEPLIYRVYKVGGKILIDFNPYSGQKNEFEITETSNHVVNTNFTYNPRAYLDMISNNKASAYGGKKYAIDSIQKNDRIFLYHSGVGICAVGRVISDEVKEKKDEKYVECNFKKKIDPIKQEDKALSAREINETLGTKLSFRQTRFSLSNEEADKIEQMFMNKK